MADKGYLICIDSDGCAMDTMNSKHIRCFGPYLVKEWNLQKWEASVLKRWNEANLYSITRGINRFQGLYQALEEINRKYMPVEDIEVLREWVEHTPELSNASLKKEIKKTGSPILQKALCWSEAVNEAVQALDEKEKQPFPRVREALVYAHGFAETAIVSSANRQAVMEEWANHELLPYTDDVMAQDSGSKAHCIAKLMQKGYPKDKVLMIGDALGDYRAAQENGVFFYPILARREESSWKEFLDVAGPRFRGGKYGGGYQREKIDAFLEHLSGHA